MPCLNEADTIGVCVEKARRALHESHIDGEVIVADNGSTDDSPSIAAQLGARVVPVLTRGYGSALMGGITAARGKYIIMGDADDSYDFAEVPRFVTKLREGHDLVQGCRLPWGGGTVKPGAMPFLHRWVGNPGFSLLVRTIFKAPIHDLHCGMRGFTKQSFERLQLRCPGMEFASEMVVKASLHKEKIAEIPITLHPDGRKAHAPHLRTFRDGWRHLRFLLLMCPLWLYLIPAFLLLGSGIALMAWLTPGPQHVGRVELDVHSMLLGTLCALLGYQVLWMWAFARMHGWTTGLIPPDTLFRRISDYLYLERGLLAGGLCVIIGLALNLWLVHEWTASSLGPLDVQVTMRVALWGFTAIILGAQTIYGSFFLSMLGMNRK